MALKVRSSTLKCFRVIISSKIKDSIGCVRVVVSVRMNLSFVIKYFRSEISATGGNSVLQLLYLCARTRHAEIQSVCICYLQRLNMHVPDVDVET